MLLRLIFFSFAFLIPDCNVNLKSKPLFLKSLRLCVSARTKSEAHSPWTLDIQKIFVSLREILHLC